MSMLSKLWVIFICRDLRSRGKLDLATYLTLAYQSAILLVYIRKVAGTATDIPMLASRITKDECMWRNIACHN